MASFFYEHERYVHISKSFNDAMFVHMNNGSKSYPISLLFFAKAA